MGIFNRNYIFFVSVCAETGSLPSQVIDADINGGTASDWSEAGQLLNRWFKVNNYMSLYIIINWY